MLLRLRFNSLLHPVISATQTHPLLVVHTPHVPFLRLLHANSAASILLASLLLRMSIVPTLSAELTLTAWPRCCCCRCVSPANGCVGSHSRAGSRYDKGCHCEPVFKSQANTRDVKGLP